MTMVVVHGPTQGNLQHQSNRGASPAIFVAQVCGAIFSSGQRLMPRGTKGDRPSRVGVYAQLSSTCRAVANRTSTRPLLFLEAAFPGGNMICWYALGKNRIAPPPPLVS